MKDLLIFLLFIAMIVFYGKWVVLNRFVAFMYLSVFFVLFVYIDVIIGPKWVLELVWGSF